MLKDKRERFYKIYKKPRTTSTSSCEKKITAELKNLAKKNKKDNLENFASSLNCNTPINIAWDKTRRIKANNQKK